MKWITITLLVMNMAYFAWQFNATVQPVVKTSPFMDKEKYLVLASEQKDIEHLTALTANSLDTGIIKASLAQPPEPLSEVQTGRMVGKRPEACFKIGPFASANDVHMAAKVFESEQVYVQQSVLAERKQIGYWVYIPERPSLSAARAIMRDLGAKGIDDAMIIAEGGKANAISAGVFRAKKLAIKRQESFAKMGYQTKMEPFYRSEPSYWLDVELWEREQISNVLWRQLSTSFPSINQQKRECEQ